MPVFPGLPEPSFRTIASVPDDGFAMTELRYGSGLFNLMRNLGGAIGIAVVNTWLQDNTRIEAARFGEALGANERIADDTMLDLSHRMAAVTPDPAHALLLAQGLIGRVVGQEALTVAFNDEGLKTTTKLYYNQNSKANRYNN